MNKRAFLRWSATWLGALLFLPRWLRAQTSRLTNWAGNITYSTDRVYNPGSAAELQALIPRLSELRAQGTRHCFNRIADSTKNLVCVRKLDQVLSLQPEQQRVTVAGGITYGQLGPYLERRGFALHNLASLPHISVAGACVTATHGSGVGNRNLSGAVTALRWMGANGKEHFLSREKFPEPFAGAVVNLGALGVITELELAIQPTYQILQKVFLDLPFSELKEHFQPIMSAGYSVSLFTDWKTDRINEVWVKRTLRQEQAQPLGEVFFGAQAAHRDLHPIADLSAENCTPQQGVPGPWFERLPHFKMGFTPSSGKELQAEYFVPFERAVEAMEAVAGLGEKISPHLFISEIRTIAEDGLWMSPCYGRPSVAIHFTWKQETEPVMQLLPAIEELLKPYGVRPHWGKLFTLSPAWVQAQYPRLADFKRLVGQYDPQGKFRNEFLQNLLYSG